MARGRFRVYLGAAPGVGKTHAMLDEGRRRAGRGTDVVIGLVRTQGRVGLDDLASKLETIPPHMTAGGPELDVAAVLDRHPAVVLVDDLAHHEGPQGPARWQQFEPLLEAGIEVITTVDISNLASLRDVITTITGLAPVETVPDDVVRGADQVELVDMSPEALRRRLAHGHIHPPERIDVAMANMFRPEVLSALRQLTLLWLAERIEAERQRDRAQTSVGEPPVTRERIVVALGGDGGDRLVRRAAQMAGRVGGQLVGVHVVSAHQPLGPDLERQRGLLVELGGTYREIVGDDIAEALTAFARVEQATQLVLGAPPGPGQGPGRSRSPSVVDGVLATGTAADVHLVATEWATLRSAAPTPRTRRPSRPFRQVIAAWVLILAFVIPHYIVSAVFYPNLEANHQMFVYLDVFRSISLFGLLIAALLVLFPSAAYYIWTR